MSSARSTQHRRRRLSVERLEDRAVPAVFNVSSTADSGANSLRQALHDAMANSDANDTIMFASSLGGKTITLATDAADTTFGPTAFVISGQGSITIDGSAAPFLQLSGGGARRLFAVQSGATLNLRDLTIADGMSQGVQGTVFGSSGGSGLGGGVLNQGTLNLLRTTFVGNTAQGGAAGAGGGAGSGLGGAIFNNSGAVRIINSTFSDNTALGGAGTTFTPPGKGFGGAIFTHNGSVYIAHGTLAFNSAPDGGGAVYVMGNGVVATATINNSILSNSDSTDFAGSAMNGGRLDTKGGGNLIVRNGNGGFLGAFATADPMLAALANNGGTTRTHALQAGSPARDAGDPSRSIDDARAPILGDQRGAAFARKVGSAVDIGALELGNAPPSLVVPSRITLREDGLIGVAMVEPIGTFTVSDSDAGENPLKVTLSIDQGSILIFDSVKAAALSNFTGNGTSSLTFTAPQSAINGALGALILQFPPDLFGNLTLTLTVDDQGFSGPDGAKQTTALIPVTIAPVADTPTVTNPVVKPDEVATVVIKRAAGDGAEVTHVRITGISRGQLFADAGRTQAIRNGDFLAFATNSDTITVYFQPEAGFKGATTLNVQASLDDSDVGLGGDTVARLTFRPPVSYFATGADAGGMPIARVYDAITGAEVFNVQPYPTGFPGGVRVAVGDVNGDGTPDLVTGADAGGGPHVKVVDGAKLAQIPANSVVPSSMLFYSFFAFAPTFTGGVRVAAADVTGDGRADLILGAGTTGGPHVRVVDGATFGNVFSFFAFDTPYTGGLYLAGGDVDGDGRAEIVVSQGTGVGARVRVFDGRDSHLRGETSPFSHLVLNGARVGMVDRDGDGRDDILVAAGRGFQPRVVTLQGSSLAKMSEFNAFDAAFLGGVFVG